MQGVEPVELKAWLPKIEDLSLQKRGKCGRSCMEESSKEEQEVCKNIRRAMDWDMSYGMSSYFLGMFAQQCREGKKFVSPRPE